jgi:hypothetical protein
LVSLIEGAPFLGNLALHTHPKSLPQRGALL